MKFKTISPIHPMYGISLVLAPLLQAFSSLYWINGEYGVRGGTLLVFSMLFWIPAMIALFRLVKPQLPNFAEWGLVIAVYGFISGLGFAFVGVFAEIFGISHDQYIEAFSKYPLAADLLLFQPGPLAPLSLVVLGLVLLKLKAVPARIAIMITLGGIVFPVSRISRVQWTAHVADALLFLPMIELSVRSRCRREN